VALRLLVDLGDLHQPPPQRQRVPLLSESARGRAGGYFRSTRAL